MGRRVQAFDRAMIRCVVQVRFDGDLLPGLISGVAATDFGLELLAKMRGGEAAKFIQLVMEYDPQPPFDAGSPKKAGPALVKQVLDAVEPIRRATLQIAEQM